MLYEFRDSYRQPVTGGKRSWSSSDLSFKGPLNNYVHLSQQSVRLIPSQSILSWGLPAIFIMDVAIPILTPFNVFGVRCYAGFREINKASLVIYVYLYLYRKPHKLHGRCQKFKLV